MLLSAVYVLVVAQSSSEVPEGLMNNPVLVPFNYHSIQFKILIVLLNEPKTDNVKPVYMGNARDQNFFLLQAGSVSYCLDPPDSRFLGL